MPKNRTRSRSESPKKNEKDIEDDLEKPKQELEDFKNEIRETFKASNAAMLATNSKVNKTLWMELKKW